MEPAAAAGGSGGQAGVGGEEGRPSGRGDPRHRRQRGDGGGWQARAGADHKGSGRSAGASRGRRQRGRRHGRSGSQASDARGQASGSWTGPQDDGGFKVLSYVQPECATAGCAAENNQAISRRPRPRHGSGSDVRERRHQPLRPRAAEPHPRLDRRRCRIGHAHPSSPHCAVRAGRRFENHAAGGATCCFRVHAIRGCRAAETSTSHRRIDPALGLLSNYTAEILLASLDQNPAGA